MRNRFKANSSVELLTVLTIFIILMLGTKSKVIKVSDAQIARVQLRTLKNLLNFARSKAIKFSTTTYICPTSDRKSCGHNWNAGIMIFMIDPYLGLKILDFINHPFAKYPINNLSRLRFFGNQNEQKITFLANGLTINNGHFCTDLKNLYCLYINQAGQIYLNFDD